MQLIDPEHLIDDTLLLKYAASQLFGAVLNQAIREIDNEVHPRRPQRWRRRRVEVHC